MLPRCFFTMRCTVARPRLIPSPTPLVVKKGSKMCVCTSGEIPGPLSPIYHDAGIVAIGPNAKLALASHRIDGVIDQVGPNLVELAAKRIDKQGDALILALNGHSA